MEHWPSARPAPAEPVHHAAPSAPEPAHYVPIPRRLAADLRDTPAAVGAYALVARAFRASGQPVPLSPGDLQSYDPALSYGAATRALQRLVAAGWLIAARRPGRKTTYAPSWGLVRGAALPWDLAAPGLGRPRHITALRLDQRLLDVCMGRIETHPTHPALIHRYLEAPLLGLREVGAYALALAGLPVASQTLEQLRLIERDQPQPLPDEATILAVASQRGAGALTPAGWRRTPFGDAAAPAPAEAAPGQALFFVPPGQIGPMIGGMIAGPITISGDPEGRSAASGSPAAPATEAPAGSHGVMDSDRVKPTTSPAAPPRPAAGGGHSSLTSISDPQPPAPSETARLLRSVGVRHGVIAHLANRPASQVARVIAQARARSDVRDMAGWVVSALRELPEIEEVPSGPPPSSLTIFQRTDLPDELRDRWVRRFHAATTPAEKRAVLARLAQEHPDERA